MMIITSYEQEKPAIREYFSNLVPNFVGIGFGNVKDGELYTQENCIRVYAKTLDQGTLPSSYKMSSGVEIQVQYLAVGEVKFTGFLGRYRPAQPGAVLGAAGGPYSGTLGAIVTDNTDAKKVILSCNHVMANWDTLPIGTDIIQPSAGYGGLNPADKIGTLKRTVAPDFSPFGINYVDAAIATPTTTSIVSSTPFCSSVKPTKQGAVGLLFAASPVITIINPIGPLLSLMNVSVPKQKTATVGMSIHACTAKTGYITTTVSEVMVDLLLTADNGNDVWFLDQTTCVGGIGDGFNGDSGAMFYTTFLV